MNNEEEGVFIITNKNNISNVIKEPSFYCEYDNQTYIDLLPIFVLCEVQN
jgi:hypothetical protein